MKMIDPNTRFDENITAQAVFDHVAHHLGTQDKRSVMQNSLCVYRGPEERSCAVGYLLKDDEVYPEINGKSIRNLVSRGLCPQRLDKHEDLLGALQSIHDAAENWEEPFRLRMRTRLEARAKAHGLESSILDNPDLIWNK